MNVRPPITQPSSLCEFRPITHGRHCPCSPCKREDWSKVAAPCGMHGSDCPPVWAPIPPERRAFAVRLPRGLIVADHGQPMATREHADALRQQIEQMLGETDPVPSVPDGRNLTYRDFEQILLALGASGSDVQRLWPGDRLS